MSTPFDYLQNSKMIFSSFFLDVFNISVVVGVTYVIIFADVSQELANS
jgi:hypothetical protein